MDEMIETLETKAAAWVRALKADHAVIVGRAANGTACLDDEQAEKLPRKLLAIEGVDTFIASCEAIDAIALRKMRQATAKTQARLR